MSTLADLLADHTTLSDAAGAHLQRLVAEWQLLADLSFADFLLAVQTEDGALVTVAQCRPNTASTVYPRDEVGSAVDDLHAIPLRAAMDEVRIVREQDSRWHGTTAVRREAIPVTYRGEVLAVATRAVDVTHPRLPSPLELAYQDSANDLCQMVADGTFPEPEGTTSGLSTPRAGDGFVRIDGDGIVTYASPNALSAFHRMGWRAELGQRKLSTVTSAVLTDRFESEDTAQMIETAAGVRSLPEGPYREISMRMEVDARRATVLLRAVPLWPRGESTGAIVLIRDVTEVKRRDLALISKDATIREIHHRVKNNLQSVSALLRLQARRTPNPEAQVALNEAVRRVASIALVHELLSGSVDEEVDLDTVVERLIPILVDVASGEASVDVTRTNRLGVLPADMAMPLVMVLTELIQNSIEHGLVGAEAGARIEIKADRDVRRLAIEIIDNGAGLPDGFDLSTSDHLGLRIVQTMVSIDLGGTLEMASRPAGGTGVKVVIPLR